MYLFLCKRGRRVRIRKRRRSEIEIESESEKQKKRNMQKIAHKKCLKKREERHYLAVENRIFFCVQKIEINAWQRREKIKHQKKRKKFGRQKKR